MRGCVTLLTFIAMLLLPFVVFGYTAVAFIVAVIVFGGLWLLGRGLQALGDALAQDDEEEVVDEREEEHRSV